MGKLENGFALPGKSRLPFPLDLVPEAARPYLELIRFHKPTGTVLMFWPFAWGLTMAAYRVELDLTRYWVDLAKFLVAAFIVRSSACTINDIFDREYDAGVERTKNRPLPSGRISVSSAFMYLAVQYLAGIALYASYTGVAYYAALVQLLPLFIIYPFMKRITYWPQAWLGICMNFGLVVAWAATTGNLDDVYLIGTLLTGTWGWTMHYDTIYACQDLKDDVVVGVKSTAVMLGGAGGHVRPFTAACAALFVASLAYAGHLNGQSPVFYVVAVGGTAAHMLFQYATVDLGSPESCGVNFIRNGHMGWITWGGMMLDYLHKTGWLGFATPLASL